MVFKTFYVNRPSKFSFMAVALILLAALSIGVIIINRGVYFADFHSSQLVQITSDGSVDILDQYTSSPYLAHVDHTNSILEFQSIPAETLNKIVSDIKSIKGVTVVSVINQTRILPVDILARLIWGALGVLVITFMYMYLVTLRKLFNLNSKLAWQMLGLYVLSLGIGLVTSFGAISLVSRFYELSDISIASLMIAYLWGISLIMLVLQENWEQSKAFFNYLPEVLALNRRRLAWLNNAAAVVWMLILAGAILGLGKRFVIEGVLMAAGLTFVSLSIQVLPNFLLRINTSDIKSYAKMLKSYNAQAVPLYNQQVEAAAKPNNTSTRKQSRRAGGKGHKPKRR